jgi:hypothetical protein
MTNDMKMKRILFVFMTLLYVGGCVIFLLKGNWDLLVGIMLLLWANNVGQAIKRGNY